MALYFLLLDNTTLRDDIRPALASSWQQQNFEPCLQLCARLLPTAMEFCARYHVKDEPLLARLRDGLPLDRAIWEHLAGELLWFSAIKIPELETNAEALTCLVSPLTPIDS